MKGTFLTAYSVVFVTKSLIDSHQNRKVYFISVRIHLTCIAHEKLTESVHDQSYKCYRLVRPTEREANKTKLQKIT